MRRPLLASLASLALVVGASCSTFDPNAATVNGEEINRRDFEDDLRSLRDNENFVNTIGQTVEGPLANSLSTDFAATELTDRIMGSLVHEELAARRLTIEPSVSEVVTTAAPSLLLGAQPGAAETYAQLPADYRATFERETAERFTLALALNDQTVDGLSAGPAGELSQAPRVCVSAIVTATEADAQAVIDELTGGATFADVAAASSIDPTLAQTGGKLRLADGSCPSGEQLLSLGEEFVAALGTVDAGTPTAPIPIEDFFVVARIDVDPTEQLQSLSSTQNEAFSTWLTTAVADAEISVDPRYGQWDPAQATVVSPASGAPVDVAT